LLLLLLAGARDNLSGSRCYRTTCCCELCTKLLHQLLLLLLLLACGAASNRARRTKPCAICSTGGVHF
jgi:hypothetical protein